MNADMGHKNAMTFAVALFPLLLAGVFAESMHLVSHPLQSDGYETVPEENASEEYIDAAVDGDISIQKGVRFELFTPENPDTAQFLSPSNDTLLDTNYDPNRPTRMIIHGWNSKGKLTPKFTEAYFKRANINVNVIAVNWRDLSEADYAAARSRVVAVGLYVAEFIDNLVNRANLKLNDFVLIGHSLGAHISGIAGKHLMSGKIGKIVGLDPALPLFYNTDINARLTSTDAEYVETIHTSADKFGFAVPIGHASFYPNGGIKQPGCGWDLVGNCAHSRSYLYYIESIHSPIKFLGARCESWHDVLHNRCVVTDDSVLSEMGGENGSNTTNTNGVFFFETNSKPIFSLGPQIVHNRKPNGKLLRSI